MRLESKDENKYTRMVTGPLHAIFFLLLDNPDTS